MSKSSGRRHSPNAAVSRFPARHWRRAASRLSAVAVTAGGLAFAGTAAAQTAVSAPNAKVDLRGGYEKSIGGGLNGGFVAGTGSYTMPLGQVLGLQLDGGIGLVDGEFYGGGGAHLFWRNPTTGLFGAFGQLSTLDSAYLGRAGARGEFYWNWITLGGYAGYQMGDKGKSVRVKDGWIGGLDLTGYVSDNFALRGGVGIEAGRWYGRGGIEVQPGFSSMPGLTLFAEGGGGEDRQVFGLAGVRFYFGADKSLKRRHREDDPVALPLTELPQYRRYDRSNVGGGGGNDTLPD